jgi:hypothetical protein
VKLLDPIQAQSEKCGELASIIAGQSRCAFAQLEYLSALRDAASGRYRHPLISSAFCEDMTDKVLRQKHSEVFMHWLSFSLARQWSELQGFFSVLDEGHKIASVIDSWIENSSYRRLAPFECEDHERTLFCSDLQTLLPMLRAELHDQPVKVNLTQEQWAGLLGKRPRTLFWKSM